MLPAYLKFWRTEGRSPFVRRLVDYKATILVALVLGLTSGITSVGIDLDRGLQLWRASLYQRAATSHLAFVEIDAKSLAAIHHWPWPRDRYVAAIDMLRRGGAATIAFDVDFSAPSTPDQDVALAHSIAESSIPIILPTFRQAASHDGQGDFENLPIPSLREHAQLAAVNIFADADGLVRSYPYGVTTGGVPRPSIGAMLAGVAGKVGDNFPIDLSIDPNSVPHVSFIDLVDGKFPSDLFRGRNVLIGASAIELGDRYPIPGRGVVPGPMIQLLAADTLLQDSMPTDHGFLIPLILVVICLACAGLVNRARRGLLFATSAGTILVLPLVFEASKLGTFTIVPGLAALLGAGLTDVIVSLVKSAREARFIDDATGLPNGRSLQKLANEHEGVVVIALRLANYGDIASVLGRASAAEFVGRAAERVAYAGDTAIHRIDESALAWLIHTVDDEDQIQRIDAAAAVLRAPFDIAGRRVELSHGFGLAVATGSDAITRATHAADRAVAASLRWTRFTADMEKESEWRLSLASELDHAMSAGDIWVAYQPKFDIVAQQITAAEALVRWRHPERGVIPPDAFIPALEESGRIADLTLYVLEQALTDRSSWADRGVELDVAVNLSALLPADAQFVARLEAALARYPQGVPHLTLEVTESATMLDPETAIRALDGLANLGLSLSIDDYGTGQSTLSYLKRLPAREIKIDKGFVLGIEASKSDQAMVRSTIELAHELGFKVVAEGVETEAALQLLRSFGCDVAQGWHIGRPVPACDLFALMDSPVAKSA